MTNPRTITSIIDGRPVPDGREARSTNPARLDEVVAHVRMAGAATFVDACRAARAAQGAWADVPPPVRGRAVGALGRIVEANTERLANLVVREIGKPLAEARGEVREIVDTCEYFSGEGRRLYGQTVPSEMPDKTLLTFREPVGVMAVITAGNFPVAVPSWYLVPALLCGNAVVWKPADYSPACSQALYELLDAAGFPAGVVNLVLAGGDDTFAGLADALALGLVDKIGFTGSSDTGAEIGALAGRHLQSACLELGGKNPMVVTPSADLELAVEGALFSGFGTAGQRCTSLGTVIVHRDAHREFVDRLDQALRGARIGDPFAPEVLYGPMLDVKFGERFSGYLDRLAGHHRLLGSTGTGRITSSNPRDGFVGDPDAGWFAHPTVADAMRSDDWLFANETFGPLVGVMTYERLDEAIELANAPGYGLSASIYTADPVEAFRFRRGVRAGMVSINNSTSGAEAHLPFGGNGRSGNGSRQSGLWVLDQVTRWQAVNWDWSGRLQRAQLDVADIAPDLAFTLPG